MADQFDLQRFVDAQAQIYDRVCAELRAGAKRSHWMWFIFPQIAGLGLSAMSQRFAISGRDEAVAYLHHPVLGPRLEDCVRIITAHEGRSAHAIFGSPDDMKLRSCLTLFAAVAPGGGIYATALAKYFAGDADPATLARL
jgi:uncharacterized protein (DUF1810 family)